MTFLVIIYKFVITPICAASVHFPPISGKLFLLLLQNFPPDFVKYKCFLHTFCVFRFPHTLIMMHLCITQCTYWTPLVLGIIYGRKNGRLGVNRNPMSLIASQAKS